MNTFSGFCISACIFMIFIGLASAVVTNLNVDSGTGVFPSSSSPNIDTSEAQGTFGPSNVHSVIWITGGIATLALVIFAFLRNSMNLIGLAIFSGVFWTSWLSMIPIFDNFGFTTNPTGLAIITMLTIGMGVMFVGAVIGILVPGGTAMR